MMEAVQSKSLSLAGLLTNVNPKNLIKPDTASGACYQLLWFRDCRTSQNLTLATCQNLTLKPLR